MRNIPTYIHPHLQSIRIEMRRYVGPCQSHGMLPEAANPARSGLPADQSQGLGLFVTFMLDGHLQGILRTIVREWRRTAHDGRWQKQSRSCQWSTAAPRSRSFSTSSRHILVLYNMCELRTPNPLTVSSFPACRGFGGFSRLSRCCCFISRLFAGQPRTAKWNKTV